MLSKTVQQVKKMWYIYTMEYQAAIKRNNIGSSVETWMDLETVIQSEVSQKEKNKYRILMHICGIQKNGTDEPFARQKQRHRCREQTYGHQGEKAGVGGRVWGGGGRMNREIGIDIYTLICIKQMTNKNLQYKKTNKQKQTTNTKLSLGYLYGNMLI